MFTEQIRHFIEQHSLLTDADRVLVGVSGGVDSVVLFHVLQQLGYAVSVAHVNYQLRGDAADADAALVRSLCESEGVSFFSFRQDAKVYADEHRQSIQEAARDIRYTYFQRIASDEGINHVAVAHHLDDQAETVLLNLLRGSGPEGLAGMRASRALAESSPVRLVRPFLGCWRRDIVAYAQAEGLSWREDVSNTNPVYRRSAVRTEILPLLISHFGEAAVRNIVRSADLVRGYVEDTLQEELAQHFEDVSQAQPNGGQLDLAALQALPGVWQGRVILEACKRWLPSAPRTQSFVEEVKGLLEAQVGRRVELETGTIWRERKHLRWVQDGHNGEDRQESYLLAWGNTLSLPDGTIRMENMEKRPASLKSKTPGTVLMDAESLKMPLVVRPWQAGDRMQPLGMTGTKKISDILTDAQVPSYQRRGVWVVCSGDEIVWVVGVRIAEGVRVQPETRRIVKITYKPQQSYEE